LAFTATDVAVDSTDEVATVLTSTRRFNTSCTDGDSTSVLPDQWLRSLSLDPARGRLLMMTASQQHNDASGFSLVSAPVCQECSSNGSNIVRFFVDAQISPPEFKVRLAVHVNLRQAGLLSRLVWRCRLTV